MSRNSNENVTIESLGKKTVHDEIPTVADYYSNLNTFATLSIAIGILLFIFNVTIYILTIKQLLKRVRKQYLNHIITLNSLYTIVSLSVLIAILVPKLILICHTITHLTFVFGSLIYYKLCLLYINGVDNFLKESDSDILSIRTHPCCCCCSFIKPMSATKRRLKIISYMIYQLPFVQLLLVLTLNIIFVREVQIYRSCNLYFIPFMFSSILISIWGLNIITKMVGSHLKENHFMRQKFVSLQLILVLCKLQFIVLNLTLETIDYGGVYPITNQVYKQNIISLIILLEMFPLSLFAKWAYKFPTLTHL